MIATPSAGDSDGKPEPADPPPSRSAIVVIDVGNTTTALGVWDNMLVTASQRLPTGDTARLSETLADLCRRFSDRKPVVAAATVVPDAGRWLADGVASAGGKKPVLVRDHIPLPIPVAVREPDRVGVDRVCAAAAAFDRTGHACTVVDFGTAVTVDLVDDEGTFVGGAILPGPALQARALAEGTAALPLVEPMLPEQAIGRDTAEAIRSGICYGTVGAVRTLVEKYATLLNTWPQVVATGGDMRGLVEQCDFIDSCVPHLTLMGVGLAYARHRASSKA